MSLSLTLTLRVIGLNQWSALQQQGAPTLGSGLTCPPALLSSSPSDSCRGARGGGCFLFFLTKTFSIKCFLKEWIQWEYFYFPYILYWLMSVQALWRSEKLTLPGLEQGHNDQRNSGTLGERVMAHRPATSLNTKWMCSTVWIVPSWSSWIVITLHLPGYMQNVLYHILSPPFTPSTTNKMFIVEKREPPFICLIRLLSVNISCLFTLVCHWQRHAPIWECFSAGTSRTKINTGVVCWWADVNTSDVTDTHCNKQNHETMIWD